MIGSPPVAPVDAGPNEADDEAYVPKRRKLGEADLDITPMIDVTFLLLIFFMVTSTMQETDSTDIPPARFGVGTETGESIMITLRRPISEGDEPTVVFPGGDERALSEAVEAETLKNLVEAGLNEIPRTERVIVNADRDLPFGDVRRLTSGLSDFEEIRLFFGVQDPASR
ncbi:ExbD/TolR family protein [Stratiformator vulcanicus]|uniref:Biopolymer transport protein ExbD/TolR n=1 Tax=Stratiformator vulcanicus TaxID=2527980 RepID=A0A517R1N7_9PLAN|nr:biopolymer transporter ExbD [Stratiformator vulcanicus]QDT37771.1 Biopolymer transport protein ExbD/TolR [Stratiformator vulcanicus]